MFTLISQRSKVIKYTNSYFRQPHIVPKLLTMVTTKSFNRLTFDNDLITNQKINKVFMLNSLAMKINREVIFSRI